MSCQLRGVFRLCHQGNLGVCFEGGVGVAFETDWPLERRGNANKRCYQLALWGF